MTIPVSAKEIGNCLRPTTREFNFAFYLPSGYQERPPQPNNTALYLEKRPEQIVFVR